MKILYLINICSLIIAGSMLSLIENDTIAKDIPDEGSPPYTIIENYIRTKYDIYSVFRWDEYRNLLDLLLDDKFWVLPINEMRSTFDTSKVVVGLRHDVDFNPFKALEMAKMEQLYGFRATYFILATAEYSGKITGSGLERSKGIEYLFKEIHDSGAEIGIHNDLLAIQVLHGIDPLKFNCEEMKFYKDLGIPIYGTASHGSLFARSSVPNYQVFADFAKTDSAIYQGTKFPLGKYSLKEFGFMYEAYYIDFGHYYSESGGRWNDPEGLNGVLNKLAKSKPGDRIQILVHPDWWGKN